MKSKFNKLFKTIMENIGYDIPNSLLNNPISLKLVLTNYDIEQYLLVMNEGLDKTDVNTIWTQKTFYDNQKIDNRQCYLIYTGNILIGAVDICNADGEYFYIENMTILIKYRNKGFGKAAVCSIVNTITKDHPSTDIALLVSTENKAAIHVYESCGFIITRKNGTKYYIMKYYGVSTESLTAKKVVYYISSINKSSICLIPRIPNNEFIEWEVEDGVTPRVCLASSVKKCLLAIGRNLVGKTLYVYRKILTEEEMHYLVIPTKKQVPDVDITHEMWYTKPITLDKCMTIHIDENQTDAKKYTLKLIKNDGTIYVGHPCEWNYTVVDLKLQD